MIGLGCVENPGYHSMGKNQIYYMHFLPGEKALGQVLLAGPFVSERPLTYGMWIKWARYLNVNGLEVLMFDYRGTGESSEEFESVCPDMWLEDLEEMAKWFTDKNKENHLIIHGLGIGGLLASIVFDKGIGDGLLMWSPTPSMNQMLYTTLRQRCASDLVLNPNGPRKTRKDYIKDIENEELIEVEGFQWSKRLWEQSFGYNYIEPKSSGKPWKSVELKKDAGPLYLNRLFAPPNPVGESRLFELDPNLDHIFQPNLDWIIGSLKKVRD